MITDKIAGDAPCEAFDLLWHVYCAAPSVTSVSMTAGGDVGDVFRHGLARLEDIRPTPCGLDRIDLAIRVWDALRGNAYR